MKKHLNYLQNHPEEKKSSDLLSSSLPEGTEDSLQISITDTELSTEGQAQFVVCCIRG
jgi:hypothetical protein